MEDYRQDHIRNFCIIAHVDHGKSTLADRILEITGAISDRDMQDQALDTMDIERERGITIKMTAVRLGYKSDDGDEYELNLIDTPGHVDFTYEVSRSLAACEGALLVVDAAQGVEAQTLANVNLAMNHGLELIPVINKIDLPAADPERVREEIETVGIFRPKMETTKLLKTGEVGFFTASVKTIGEATVGDTVTDAARPATEQLPGYRKAKPMVFCGLYPVDSSDYPELREALD